MLKKVKIIKKKEEFCVLTHIYTITTHKHPYNLGIGLSIRVITQYLTQPKTPDILGTHIQPTSKIANILGTHTIPEKPLSINFAFNMLD
jgi:hypothetical protein